MTSPNPDSDLWCMIVIPVLQMGSWDSEGEGTTQKPMSSIKGNWDPTPKQVWPACPQSPHSEIRENEEIKDVPTSSNCGVRVPGPFSVLLLLPSFLPKCQESLSYHLLSPNHMGHMAVSFLNDNVTSKQPSPVRTCLSFMREKEPTADVCLQAEFQDHKGGKG